MVRSRSFRFGVFCVAALLLMAGQLARAQQGTIRGTVVDSGGKPIRDAAVFVTSARQTARTDDRGRFTLDRLPLGEVELSVRSIGYFPNKTSVVAGQGIDSVRVMLDAQFDILDAMTTSASEKRYRQGIEDFYWRAVRGTGVFFTREQIVARQPQFTSDMLRDTPGVRLVRASGVQGVRFAGGTGMRGCIPLIWIDGQRAEGLEVDEFPVGDLEGIELYQGASTTPSQFSARSTGCGTIVLWSRSPTPVPGRPAP